MPADDGVRLHEDEDRTLLRQVAGKPRPEQAVGRFETSSSRRAGQHGKLMSQGDILEDEVSVREECTPSAEDEQPEKEQYGQILLVERYARVDHESTLARD